MCHDYRRGGGALGPKISISYGCTIYPAVILYIIFPRGLLSFLITEGLPELMSKLPFEHPSLEVYASKADNMAAHVFLYQKQVPK
jgi:hypothetical protein